MEATTILSLFDAKNRKFRIPEYQRSYSWGEKQLNQFIEDLHNVHNQYYLGHFLFEKADDEENTLLVIDGQQRLTTCIIFFSCIRKALQSRPDHTIDLEDIQDYYIKDIRKGIQKFHTVRLDDNYFHDVIIEGECNNMTDSRSQECILNAKNMFDDEFKKTSTEELERWYNLVQYASTTQYIVNDKIQATQIFAFQNDRGKPLTKLEVLKSYFMLQIYLLSSDREVANNHISYIENVFSKIYSQIVRINLSEDDVLRYYWMAFGSKGFYCNDVVDDVKSFITTFNGDKIEWIKKFVSHIPCAFNTISTIEKSTLEDIVDLRYLNHMALSYPFFIKASLLNISENTFKRLAKFLENITFRSLLRGGRADITSRLNPILINVNSDESFNNKLDETLNNYFKCNEWWNYWSDNELKSHLNSGSFYGNSVDNYVLWKYEMYISSVYYPLSHKTSFRDFIRNESIEHIAPRTPTNGDPLANGYGIYDDKDNPNNGISSGERLNSIGNLMLISQNQNSAIGNKSFVDKLKVYGENNLLNQQREIENFVHDKKFPIWDVSAIDNRRQKIISAAMDIWSWDKI